MQAPDPYPSRAIPLRALEEDDYVEAVSARIPEQHLHHISSMHQPTYRTERSLHSNLVSPIYIVQYYDIQMCVQRKGPCPIFTRC